LVGAAVKVTDAPLHIGLVDGVIATLTGRFGFTVIVVVGDVAGEPVAQVALEVRIHVTASLLLNDDEVYVVLFVPTLEPLTCH